MKWRVDKEMIIADPGRGSGWDVERAIALHLVQGKSIKRTLVVGYDVGAPTITARMAAQPYLDADEPPKRLIVRRDGQITVKEP